MLEINEGDKRSTSTSMEELQAKADELAEKEFIGIQEVENHPKANTKDSSLKTLIISGGKIIEKIFMGKNGKSNRVKESEENQYKD